MFYLMTYPSSWGMGSDSDIFLVSEENLRRLIEGELKKKEDGIAYSDDYTGKWSYGEFCQGKSEEIIQDIIRERLNTRNTYAGRNDLIQLPEDIPVTVKRERMTDKIFRVFNQWSYHRDVIVHDAEFIRYIVDFNEYDELANLAGLAGYCEFVRFHFKNVLMNQFFHDSKEVVTAMLKAKIERLEKKVAGEKVPKQGYLDDYLDLDDRLFQEMAAGIEVDKKTLAHLEEKLPPMKDDYYEHLYKTDYGYFEQAFQESIKGDDRDHTEYVYSMLLSPDTFGGLCSGYQESSKAHRFDEIFRGECSLEFLLGSLTVIDSDGTFGKVDIQYTLLSLLGYD